MLAQNSKILGTGTPNVPQCIEFGRRKAASGIIGTDDKARRLPGLQWCAAKPKGTVLYLKRKKYCAGNGDAFKRGDCVA